MKLLVTLAALLLSAAAIDEKCRECICANSMGHIGNVDKCEMPTECVEWPSGTFCGPYAMDYKYWSDVGSKGGDFHTCMQDWSCVNETMDAYLTRYCTRQFINHDPPCSCEEQARIHHCGPYSMHSTLCDQYWTDDVQPCMSH